MTLHLDWELEREELLPVRVTAEVRHYWNPRYGDVLEIDETSAVDSCGRAVELTPEEVATVERVMLSGVPDADSLTWEET